MKILSSGEANPSARGSPDRPFSHSNPDMNRLSGVQRKYVPRPDRIFPIRSSCESSGPAGQQTVGAKHRFFKPRMPDPPIMGPKPSHRVEDTITTRSPSRRTACRPGPDDDPPNRLRQAARRDKSPTHFPDRIRPERLRPRRPASGSERTRETCGGAEAEKKRPHGKLPVGEHGSGDSCSSTLSRSAGSRLSTAETEVS